MDTDKNTILRPEQPAAFSPSALQQMERDIGIARCLQMVDIVLAELHKRLTALQYAFAIKEWVDVQHQAHTLKSTSASFGLLCLSDLAKRVEHYCRRRTCDVTGENSTCDDISHLIKQLPPALEAGKKALKDYRQASELS